jgi:hypothetical protein
MIFDSLVMKGTNRISVSGVVSELPEEGAIRSTVDLVRLNRRDL